jgi:hypothetical protein
MEAKAMRNFISGLFWLAGTLLIGSTQIPGQKDTFAEMFVYILLCLFIAAAVQFKWDVSFLDWLLDRDVTYRPSESSDLIGRDVNKY